MKHPNVKYQLIKIQLIGTESYKVKVKVMRGVIQSWEYVAYYKSMGKISFNENVDYDSKEEAMKALNMYQQYGLIGGEEKVIQSN